MKPFSYTLTEGQIASTPAPMTVRERIRLALHMQRYLLPFWDKVLLGIFMGVVAQFTFQLFFFLNRKFIDVGVPQKDVVVYLVVLVALGVFGFWAQPGLMTIFATLTKGICDWYIVLTVTYQLQLMFYKHLHSLSMRFFQKRPTGEHMFRAQTDVGFAIELITRPIPEIITLLGSQSLVITVALIFLPWYVIVAEYLFMLVTWTVNHWTQTVNRRLAHINLLRAQAVDAVLMNGLAGFMTVKAFGRQRSEVKRFMHILNSQIRIEFKIFWFNVLVRYLLYGSRIFSLAWFHGVFVAIVTGMLVIKGNMTLGTQGLIGIFLMNLTAPFQSFFNVFQWFRLALIPAERLRDTLSVKPSVERPKRGIRLRPLKGHVKFENVTFRYEDEDVLKNISLDIPAGTKVGIVGPSGAGKSTLLALLLRLHDPVEGRVLIDGYDLKTIHLTDYHHQIGPVLQDTFLFQGSLRENMLFARPRATDEEIFEALRRAEVMDFVNELPEGLDTDLSEGTRVSGGQKQRIGIARAILRDPAMLVLDEPTSSLDIPTEHAVVKTLNTVTEGRTTYFVSHRLGLVAGCDIILVLDQGSIVAKGTHAELLRDCELYQNLWREQYGTEAP